MNFNKHNRINIYTATNNSKVYFSFAFRPFFSSAYLLTGNERQPERSLDTPTQPSGSNNEANTSAESNATNETDTQANQNPVTDHNTDSGSSSPHSVSSLSSHESDDTTQKRTNFMVNQAISASRQAFRGINDEKIRCDENMDQAVMRCIRLQESLSSNPEVVDRDKQALANMRANLVSYPGLNNFENRPESVEEHSRFHDQDIRFMGVVSDVADTYRPRLSSNDTRDLEYLETNLPAYTTEMDHTLIVATINSHTRQGLGNQMDYIKLMREAKRVEREENQSGLTNPSAAVPQSGVAENSRVDTSTVVSGSGQLDDSNTKASTVTSTSDEKSPEVGPSNKAKRGADDVSSSSVSEPEAKRFRQDSSDIEPDFTEMPGPWDEGE